MAKPKSIELEEAGIVIPIVYEDRSMLAVDKPAGWMLAPDSWDRTGRNLQLALQSSLNAGDFWARSRNLKFLRFIHRLDAETTGLTLFAKSPGALRAYSELFEERRVEKYYLAVVRGVPKRPEWTCNLSLIPDPGMKGRMRTIQAGSGLSARTRSLREAEGEDDQKSRHRERRGSGTFADAERNDGPLLPKDAETHFRVLQALADTALVEARPTTGRTHQIRAHLGTAGHPVVGDPLYGSDKPAASKGRQRLALRAVRLAFRDPFQNRMIRIEAPAEDFIREHGFDPKEPKDLTAATPGITRLPPLHF